MSALPPSIAVLPFENLTTGIDTEHFARGFAEDLTGNLTKFTPLRVIASGSAAALGRAGASRSETARAWKIDFLMEGSVRIRGETLRVTARLVRGDG